MRKIKATPKKVAIALVALLVAGGAAFAFYSNDKSDVRGPIGTSPSGATYDLSPPTEQELKETEAHKKEITKPKPKDTTPAGQKKQVSVVITNASPDSINAYISGVLEEGGTCTATLSKGTTTITRTSESFINVSTTNCVPIQPNFPSSGKWTVKVSYSSSTAEGTSQTTVEVP